MTFLPIVERELRVAARRPGTYWLRFSLALAVILIFLFAVMNDSRERPAEIAGEVFGITSILTFAGCLCAGIIQTADCLSSEKREGTIGLLFLTDLRSYDVVLGKLVSSSINVLYGLLSILPVLALPLLMGGVSGGEFWRMVITLLAALFFSLGIGMFVSAVSRETRQAFAVTAFIVLVFTGVLPAIHASVPLVFPGANLPVQYFLWPSPGYAFRESADDYFKYRTGPHEYWGSVVTVSAIGLVGLLLAAAVLPRVWQEKGLTGKNGRGKWQSLQFGGRRRRVRLRVAMLLPNPFYWLSIRDRLPRIGVWLLSVLALFLWLPFFWTALRAAKGPGFGTSASFPLLMYTTFGFSLALKCLVAMEATRRLNDDRRNGALELLLVTPLTERQIVSAQLRSLRRIFWLPGAISLILFAALIWLICALQRGGPGNNEFIIVLGGAMVALVTDFWALGWLGMWTGLRARQHHRAILGTLARVLFFPWLVYLLLGFSGMLDGREERIKVVIASWFLFGALNDVFWVGKARRGLLNQFRPCAAEVMLKKRRRWLPMTAKPAVA